MSNDSTQASFIFHCSGNSLPLPRLLPARSSLTFDTGFAKRVVTGATSVTSPLAAPPPAELALTSLLAKRKRIVRFPLVQ